MANKKTNAAEELQADAADIQIDIEEELDASDSGPQLEVVDGDANVSNEEIQALLETMAEQNAAESDTEPTSFEEVAGSNSEAVESVETVADREVDGPDEEINAPKLTMDDVLRAASSATNMSIDEIKNLEAPAAEVATDDDPVSELAHESEDSSADVAPILESAIPTAASPDQPRAVTADSATESSGQEKSVPVAKPKGKLKVFEVLKSKLVPMLPFAAALGAASLAYLAASMATGRAASQAASRDKKMQQTLTDLETLVMNQNDRLASFDKFVAAGGATQVVASHGSSDAGLGATQASEVGHAPEQGQSAKSGAGSHDVKAESHGKAGHGSAESGKSDAHHNNETHSQSTDHTNAKGHDSSHTEKPSKESGSHGSGNSHDATQHDAHDAHDNHGGNASHGKGGVKAESHGQVAQAHQDAKLHASGSEGFKVAKGDHGKNAWHKEPHSLVTTDNHKPTSTQKAKRPTKAGPSTKRKPKARPSGLVASKAPSGSIKVYLDNTHVSSSH